MSKIKSTLIDVKLTPEDNKKLTEELGIDNKKILKPLLLRVKFEHKTYYCCMSGGCIDKENQDVLLTPVGRATLDALAVFSNQKNPEFLLVLQEIRLGKVSLEEKVKRSLRAYPSNTSICFIGDMAGELDGILLDVFNLLPSNLH